jgi:hypothetical protein
MSRADFGGGLSRRVGKKVCVGEGIIGIERLHGLAGCDLVSICPKVPKQTCGHPRLADLGSGADDDDESLWS